MLSKEVSSTIFCPNLYKWYMHKPAPILESDTHKLLWNFDIQTDHKLSVRRSYLIIINKKKKKKKKICKIVDFAVPADYRIKLKGNEKKKKKKKEILRPCWRTEKQWNIEVTLIQNCNLCERYSHQKIGTGTGGLGDKRTGGDHVTNNINEIGESTKESSRDLRKLAVT